MDVQRKEILKSHLKIQITDFLDYLWQQNNLAYPQMQVRQS